LPTGFVEGSGSNSMAGEGSGTTWHCPSDTNISNQDLDCADRWDGGGDFGGPTAPSVLHIDHLTGEMSWDVTEDVRAGVGRWLVQKSSTSPKGSKKGSKKKGSKGKGSKGKAIYFSKEGSIEAALPSIAAPRLVLQRVLPEPAPSLATSASILAEGAEAGITAGSRAARKSVDSSPSNYIEEEK
jgi:hypothetical protein